MFKNQFFVLVLCSLAFLSCGDDAPENTEYQDGVIIVNQGAFQTGTGTLTYKERGTATPIQDVYTTSNDGSFLGNIAQSMITFKDKNFISINNGGKVVVTDSDDFTLIDTIPNILGSRYFASSGDKLYVSAWGATGSDGGIYEINGNTNLVSNYVSLGNGPEGLVFADDLLYIAKGGGFRRDSLVLIMDSDDNSIVKSLVVGDNPELIVKDNNDNVYVLCKGYTDFLDASNNTDGKLVKISNQEIEWSFDIANSSNGLTIDADNGFLYFVTGGNVVKQDINSTSLNLEVIKELSAYALGFDNDEDKLYIADPKDFSSRGEIFVYSTDDEELESFSAGIIPGFFHFQ